MGSTNVALTSAVRYPAYELGSKGICVRDNFFTDLAVRTDGRLRTGIRGRSPYLVRLCCRFRGKPSRRSDLMAPTILI